MPVGLRASTAKLGPARGFLLAGATVRVHASTRGNRAFTSMDRARRENDTHSKPTLYGNKRLLGNQSGKKKEKKNKPVARTVILVAIDFC